MKYSIISLLLLSMVSLNLFSQNISVNAKIDSTIIVIGAQTRLTFEVTQSKNQKVALPVFSDTIIGALEIVESLKADTVKADGDNILVKKSYIVTSFEDSLLYIPPYPIVSNSDTFWTKSLSLKVVQPFQIDTATHQIADIKNVMEPPFNWKALIKLILLIILIIITIVLIYILVRKFIYKKPIFNDTAPEVILAPHILALNELERIRNEKAWMNNRAKNYHTELTDVLRVYIEKTFDIPCMEMTSEEIVEHLNHLRFENKTAYTALKQILNLADLVKFAKWEATIPEHEVSLTNAIVFVNETKIEEEVINPNEEGKKEQE
ncbi:MAG: cell wall anchor protein [Paludibacter sp.]